MVTTLENKIKVTFEFKNIAELEEVFFALNTACVSIHYREIHSDKESEKEMLDNSWHKVFSIADKFNPANFRNA